MRRRHRIGRPCVGFGLARWVRRAAFVRLLDIMRVWLRLPLFIYQRRCPARGTRNSMNDFNETHLPHACNLSLNTSALLLSVVKTV